MQPLRCPTEAEGYPMMRYVSSDGNTITAFAVFSKDLMRFAAGYDLAAEQKSKQIRGSGLKLKMPGDLQDIVSKVLQSANVGATGTFQGQEAKIVADKERKVVIQTHNSEYFVDANDFVRIVTK